MKKSVLILGATSDIGMSCAAKFAQEGFNLQLTSRDLLNEDFLDFICELNNTTEVSKHELDILDYYSFDKLIEELKVLPDIVICCIGALGMQRGDQNNEKKISKMIKVNFEGPMILLEKFAYLFEERGSGTIVGVSSVAGERGRASNYIYGSAKAGFTTFLEGMNHRFGRSKINVIAVLPGFVDTKMTNHMDIPKLLTANRKKLANVIYKAHKKRKSKVYYLPIWRFIIFLIRILPTIIFSKLKI